MCGGNDLPFPSFLAIIHHASESDAIVVGGGEDAKGVGRGFHPQLDLVQTYVLSCQLLATMCGHLSCDVAKKGYFAAFIDEQVSLGNQAASFAMLTASV